MMMSNHPFHLVSFSPWPILSAFSSFSLFLNLTLMMWGEPSLPLFNTLSMIMCFYQWMRDIVRESTYQGKHNKLVIKGLKMGMILFITSEVMLFMSLFWMVIHLSISPPPILGNSWPPKNIIPFNPMGIPLFNTCLLISSGFMITWSHFSMLKNKKKEASWSLLGSITCGMIFISIQYMEYKTASFTMTDCSYGSAFFLTTGFHGLHVLVGTMFLSISLVRLMMSQMTKIHHINFEASAWYWHFVDVVWIFVYLIIYF